MGFSSDYIIPRQNEETKKVYNEATANEEAIYTIGINGDPNFEDINQLSQDLQAGTGDEKLEELDNINSQKDKKQQLESLIQIIESDEYDPATKKEVVNGYKDNEFYITRDKKQMFIEDISTFTDTIDDETQSEHISIINNQIKNKEDFESIKQEKEYAKETIEQLRLPTNSIYESLPTIPKTKDGRVDWKQWGKQTTGETLGILNFWSSIPYALTYLNTRWALTAKQKQERGEVNWEEVTADAEQIMQEADNLWYKFARNITMEQYADKLGVGDEFREAATTKALSSIHDGLKFLGKKGTEAGIFSNPEQGALIIETALVGYPIARRIGKGVKDSFNDNFVVEEFLDGKTGQFKRRTKRKSDLNRDEKIVDGSPLDTIATANPKAGGELSLSALLDPTNVIASRLNNKKYNILNDTILNQANPMTSDIINTPNLYQRITNITKTFEQNYKDNYFNPLVVRPDIVADTLKPIHAIEDNFNNKFHMSKSPIVISKDGVQGKMRFGKDQDYLIYSRTEAIDIYQNLEAALKDQYKNTKYKVYIEDLETGKQYTPSDLRKESKFFNIEDYKQSLGKDELTAADLDNYKKNLEGSERSLAVTFEFDFKFNPLDFYLENNNYLVPQTTYLGKDVTKWFTGSLGPHLGSLGAQFSNWLSEGYQRAADKSNYNSKVIVKEMNKISKSPYGVLLKDVLNKGYVQQKNFSKDEIAQQYSKFFSYYNKKDKARILNEIYSDYAVIRTIANLQHLYVNKMVRNDLIRNGFDKAIYRRGKNDQMLDPINIKQGQHDYSGVEKAFDYETGTAVAFQFSKVKDGIPVDKFGRRIVLLRYPKIEEGTQNSYLEYALVDESKFAIDFLPQSIVKKIDGYMPIVHKAEYFIEYVPNFIYLNGKYIDKTLSNNRILLENYTETLDSALTEKDAVKLRTMYEQDVPKAERKQVIQGEEVVEQVPLYKVRVRRTNNTTQDLVKDQELFEVMSRQGRSKSRRMNKNFYDEGIVDPLEALQKATVSLERLNLLDDFTAQAREGFIKQYEDHVPRNAAGEPVFPRTVEELTNESINPDAFRAAKNKLLYMEKQQTAVSKGEKIIGEQISYLLDEMEGFKLTREILKRVPELRTLSGRSLTRATNQMASLLFITLNALRQPFVQTTQILTHVGSNIVMPHQAIADVGLFTATMFRLMADAPVFKDTIAGATIKAIPYTIIGGVKIPGTSLKIMDNIAEFEAYYQAFKKSGLVESAGLNMMVEDLLHAKPKGFKQDTIIDTALKGPKTVATAAGKFFNISEFANRLYFNGVAYRLMKKKNQGTIDILDKKVQEDIFYEGWRLAGSQTRQGSFDFQHGLTSSLMQYLAVGQKIANTMLQNTATIMTPTERARVLISQAVMYGTAGVYLNNLIEELLRKYANLDSVPIEVVKYVTMGLAGYGFSTLVDNAYELLTGEEVERKSQLHYGGSVTPVGASTVPFAWADFVYEMTDVFTEKGASFRFAGLSGIKGIYGAAEKFAFWLDTKETTKEEFPEVLPRILSFISGMNNITKSYIQLASGDIVTSYGNSLGLEKTRAEAFAQILGIKTVQEDLLRKNLMDSGNRNEHIKIIAQDLHKKMAEVYLNPNFGNNDPEQQGEMKIELVGKILGMLQESGQFTKDEVQDIRRQITALDKRMTKGRSATGSILQKLWESNNEELSIDQKKQIEILEMNPSEGAKILIKELEDAGAKHKRREFK